MFQHQCQSLLTVTYLFLLEHPDDLLNLMIAFHELRALNEQIGGLLGSTSV
jgi:hypothetical protein